MKASMRTITPVYNTHRMVQEYTERFYLPSETQYQSLTYDNYAQAIELASWLTSVQQHWNEVRIISVEGYDH